MTKSLQLRHRWTKEGDHILQTAVKIYGNNFTQIARKFFMYRTGKMCGERYRQHIYPNINKNTWTEKEKQLLFLVFAKHGQSWSKIQKEMPTRSANDIKNKWRQMLKNQKTLVLKPTINNIQPLHIQHHNPTTPWTVYSQCSIYTTATCLPYPIELEPMPASNQ